VEWDFRWVGSEAEAEHVLALEQTREALRQADMRLTTSREKVALHRLIMAMTPRGAIVADPKLLSLVSGLKRSAFVAGVIAVFIGPSVLREVELPTAFKLRHRIRSISDQKLSPGAQLHITPLSKGQHFTPWPATSDKSFVFRLHQGMTAERAKEQFAEWADANLPAGPKRKGGRPELPSLGLQRLAFFRFAQASTQPRPHAAFAVSVREHASKSMASEFTEFGNRMYAPFMNPKANQPKAATWSESVSIVRKELAPIVAELVDVVKSIS
jgi:hypothetical protein